MAVRDIVTKKTILELPSEEINDLNRAKLIIEDLIDTAKHHEKTNPVGCVGLASNQIGELYRIIVIKWGGQWFPMINPIMKTSKGPQGYAKEGCLSRPGIHTKKRRYKKIHVTYIDDMGAPMEEKYSGYTARVIQHEMDHLIGVYI